MNDRQRSLRRDARNHRDALIRAAALVFRRDGYDVPLQAVLNETGLGRGTLYRHFPDRSRLIFAVAEYEHEQLEAFVEESADDPNLFAEFIRRQGQLSMALLPVFMRAEAAEVMRWAAPLMDRSDALQAHVIALAHQRGVIDDSFTVADMRLVNRMLMMAADDHRGYDAALFDRALAIVLAGITATATTSGRRVPRGRPHDLAE